MLPDFGGIAGKIWQQALSQNHLSCRELFQITVPYGLRRRTRDQLYSQTLSLTVLLGALTWNKPPRQQRVITAANRVPRAAPLLEGAQFNST